MDKLELAAILAICTVATTLIRQVAKVLIALINRRAQERDLLRLLIANAALDLAKQPPKNRAAFDSHAAHIASLIRREAARD
ncbi:MAG: hypothetical protein WBV94_24765 [Blastocatellia bacterium]